MTRKIAAIILISIVILSIVIAQRVIKRNSLIISAKERVERPDEIQYLSLDSTNLTLADFKFPMILVLISSDCEHCRYEISTFLDNTSSLKNYNVLFLSTEKIPVIARFKEETIREFHPWIHFGKITKEGLLNTFGSPVTPQIYIYNNNKVLMKHFKGETKFESILKFL